MNGPVSGEEDEKESRAGASGDGVALAVKSGGQSGSCDEDKAVDTIQGDGLPSILPRTAEPLGPVLGTIAGELGDNYVSGANGRIAVETCLRGSRDVDRPRSVDGDGIS